MKVSVIIPAKDEAETIGRVLDDLNKTIKSMKNDEFEVIVVDDGSKDRTAEIAKSKKAKVVQNLGTHGKGMALRCGFKEATGDIVIMLDADYSHLPEDIPKFIGKLKEGYGFVVGSRIYGGSEEYDLERYFGNFMLTFCFRIMFGRFLSDPLNGYKAFRKELIKEHKYRSKDFEIEIELLSNAMRDGYKIAEIPSHERARAGGTRKSKAIIHGTKFLLAIIKHGIKYRLK